MKIKLYENLCILLRSGIFEEIAYNDVKLASVASNYKMLAVRKEAHSSVHIVVGVIESADCFTILKNFKDIMC